MGRSHRNCTTRSAAERLRRQGAEFGTVTGRPRRCGWFDAVAGRYAVAINGLTGAAMTKLDVLTGFATLGIVTGYRRNGKSVGFSAIGEGDFEAEGDAELQLEVEELPGWSEPIEDCRRLEDLPPAARRYVARVEELLATPIELVSVGRERTQLADCLKGRRPRARNQPYDCAIVVRAL